VAKAFPILLEECPRLTASAVQLAKQWFDMEFDLKVYWAEGEDYQARGSCVSQRIYDKKGKILGRKPLYLQLNRKKEWTMEKIESTLKHELCHWACMIRKKPFKDGSKFFESELLRIGAGSSGRDYGEDSVEYQKKVVSGEISRLGSKHFKYEEVVNQTGEGREYRVRHKGLPIGYMIKLPRGKFCWVNNEPTSKWYRTGYVTRKDCVEDMQEEMEKAIKNALDTAWENWEKEHGAVS